MTAANLMEKRIRLGVLGCSSIADKSVLPIIASLPQFELVAVASRDPHKGQSYADKYACSSCSYTELIQHPGIDAIYISLPVGLHFEWGLATITAGKHLLLEKSFTETSEQAATVIDAARHRSLVAMEALVYVHHPLYQTVKQLVEQGAVGRLRNITAFFGFPFRPQGDIRYQHSLGGGAALDALVYPLSLCLNLIPNPYRNVSISVEYDEGYDVDLRGFLQLDWPDCSAQIGYGFGFMYRNAYAIWGEAGLLTVDRGFTRPADLKGEIQLESQGARRVVEVPAANHFEHMLLAFAGKIHGTDTAGLNEGDNILRRMEIISKVASQKPGSIGVVRGL